MNSVQRFCTKHYTYSGNEGTSKVNACVAARRYNYIAIESPHLAIKCAECQRSARADVLIDDPPEDHETVLQYHTP